MHALIADDDRMAREVLGKTLTRMGFDVTPTEDGAEAWKHLEGVEVPTLAIIDWMMPLMDGPEVLRHVRRERPLANLYLILLTSLESRRDVITGLDAGADDYIVRPFDPDELRARVQVGVRVLTLQERLTDRVAELQAALSNVKQLRGLLPICSYCKRIRGDDQYWLQVESYISDHSDAQFSHGICPACYVEVEKQIESYAKERRPPDRQDR